MPRTHYDAPPPPPRRDGSPSPVIGVPLGLLIVAPFWALVYYLLA